MSTQAAGGFKVKSWDEKPFKELEGGGKLTRATVTQAFHGDIDGDGEVEFLMSYRLDKTATFVGLQYVSGRIADRFGSFVLQVTGTFDGGTAKGEWSVVRGMGTGDLRDLSGKGRFEAPHGPDATSSLDYEFAPL